MANSLAIPIPRPHASQPSPAGQANTTPRAQQQGKVIQVPTFTISQIKDVMANKLNWPVAAKLQKEWLDAPAYTMTQHEKNGKVPPSKYAGGNRHDLIDTTTVSMAWALGFERVKKAVDTIYNPGLFGDPIYGTVNAKAVLVKLIKRAGLFGLYKEAIGNASNPALWQHEHWQFQKIPIDVSFQERTNQAIAKPDELFGAVGGFNLYLVPVGNVIPKTEVVTTVAACELRAKEYAVEITGIGIYLRDTYDFNGSQYLGHWGTEGVEIVKTYAISDLAGLVSDGDYKKPSGNPPDIKWPVGNVHYQKYRNATQKGGDLLIFSDVQFRTLKRPFKFIVTPEAVKAAQ